MREYKRMDRDQKRSENVTVILTPIELQKVQDAAADAGKPYSIFIREVLMDAISKNKEA